MFGTWNLQAPVQAVRAVASIWPIPTHSSSRKLSIALKCGQNYAVVLKQPMSVSSCDDKLYRTIYSPFGNHWIEQLCSDRFSEMAATCLCTYDMSGTRLETPNDYRQSGNEAAVNIPPFGPGSALYVQTCPHAIINENAIRTQHADNYPKKS